jgi:hypothetical protein
MRPHVLIYQPTTKVDDDTGVCTEINSQLEKSINEKGARYDEECKHKLLEESIRTWWKKGKCRKPPGCRNMAKKVIHMHEEYVIRVI